MSSFEEYAYTSHLIEQAKDEKKQIDKQVYELLNRKLELDHEINWIIEYRKSLVNKIIIKN